MTRQKKVSKETPNILQIKPTDASSNPTKIDEVKEEIKTDNKQNQLNESVKTINADLIKEGEETFFNIVPKKIKELTEYINKQSLFRLSLEEVQNAICINEKDVGDKIKNINKEVLDFDKKKEKQFAKWRKSNITTCNDIIKAKIENKYNETKEMASTFQAFDEKYIFPINQNLLDFLSYLSQQIKEAIPIFNSIQMWIILKMPSVENGNNFGVSVQKNCINCLANAQEQIQCIADSIVTYYNVRGEAVALMIRNPAIKDYVHAVIDIDHSQFYFMKLFVKSLRDTYAMIYDTIFKNYEKIQNPRLSVGSTSFFF